MTDSKGAEAMNKRRLRKTSTAIASDNRRKKNRLRRFALKVLALMVIFAGVHIFLHSGVFTLEKVVIYGNRHLGYLEVVKLMELDKGQNLIAMDMERAYDNLHSSQWIRSVQMRKELPDTLVLKIEESMPVALLQNADGLFIVDSEGLILERVKGAPVYFLPVIVHDNADGSDEFMEAVKLATAINGMSEASEIELVEIAGLENGTRNMVVRLDGVDIKVGEGDYGEKLNRYFDLSGEIGKRNINVDYIDLRFAGRVVIKPIEEVVQ